MAFQDTPPRFHVADHQLISLIETGSYGEVWMARNAMGTFRAVKVIRKAAFNERTPYESELRGIRTFEPISRSHPGFVDILHIGQSPEDDLFYYIMEIGDDLERGDRIEEANYVAKTLDRVRLQDRRLSSDKCLTLGLQLSDALSRLHEAGLVHRDIKPSNIIFFHGYPKLADIGLVTSHEDARSLVGTIGYIPPEGPGSPQADVYALGKVLYECLTGLDRSKFPDLPEFALGANKPQQFMELMEVINKAAHPDPAQRYPTARALHAELALLENGKSVLYLRALERNWSKLKRWGKVAAVLILLASFAYGWVRQRSELAEARRNQEVGRRTAASLHAWDTKNYPEALLQFGSLIEIPGEGANELLNRFRFMTSLARTPKLTLYRSVAGVVDAASLSPDGQFLALGMDDGQLLVLETRTSALRFSIKAHTEPVVGVGFDPHGERIATASLDRSAHLWNLEGHRLQSFSDDQRLTAVCFSRDGARLMTGSAYGRLKAWDVATGTLAAQWVPARTWIDSIQTTDKLMAVASRDGQVYLGDLQGQILLTLRHARAVRHLSFSPDQKRILTGCADGYAYVWSTSSGIPLLPPLRHEREVVSTEFSPDGRLVVTGSLDEQLKVWDANNGDLEYTTLPHGSQLLAARFLPDGRQIATVCYNGVLRVWDLAGMHLPQKIPRGHRFIDAGLVLDTTAQPPRLRPLSGGQPKPLEAKAPVASLVESRDRRFLVGLEETGSNSWSLRVWNAHSGAAASSPTHHAGARPEIFPGTRAFSICRSNTVESFTFAGGQSLHAPLVFPTAVQFVVPPEGTRVVVCHAKSVTVVELDTEIRRTLSHDYWVSRAVLNPRGDRLVTCTRTAGFDACYAQVWQLPDGRPLGPRLGHRDGVHDAAWSKDGKKVVTVSEDATGLIWRADTGARIGDPLRHGHQIVAVALGGDPERILTASQDGTIRFWDLATGLPLSPALPQTYAMSGVEFVGEHVVATELGGDQWVWALPVEARVAGLETELASLLSATPDRRPGKSLDVKSLVDLYNKSKIDIPEQFEVSRSEVIRWHQFQADVASAHDQLEGELFHLDHVLGIDPSATGVEQQKHRALGRALKRNSQ